MPLVDTLPYAPFAGSGQVVDGEFRWRLGVRPLDLADWIEYGSDAEGPDGWIAQKSQLNVDHADVVFAVLGGVEREADEVATSLRDHLRQRWPERYGVVELDSGLHPLDAAARLVAEDLVLMVERDGRLVFGGGSVCFPNRWDLRSKLGKTIGEVHAPVAGLNEQLGPAIDGFLDRLTAERSFWRLGWGLIDVPDGYAPVDATAGRPDRPRPDSERSDRRRVDGVTVDDLYVRVERETLRRFPTTNCVLFTIRTYVAALSRVARDVEHRAAIAAAVAAMRPAVRNYKALTRLGDEVVAALRRDDLRRDDVGHAEVDMLTLNKTE